MPPLRVLLLALLAGAAACPPAAAQDVDDSYYDGAWNVRWRCGEGSGDCSARLLISDYGGSWEHAASRNGALKACGSRKIPITVQGSTRSRLAFTVWGDTIGPNCPTLSVLVKPVDARTMTGSVEFGVHEVETPEEHAMHSGGEVPQAASAPAADAGHAAGRPIRLTRR